MGKQSFPNLVYLGALSLLTVVFTLVLIVAAVTLFIPSNFTLGFGISWRFFTVAAVVFFTAVAVVVFFSLALFNLGIRRKSFLYAFVSKTPDSDKSYAGMVRRSGAYLIDCAVMTAAFLVLQTFLFLPLSPLV